MKRQSGTVLHNVMWALLFYQRFTCIIRVCSAICFCVNFCEHVILLLGRKLNLKKTFLKGNCLNPLTLLLRNISVPKEMILTLAMRYEELILITSHAILMDQLIRKH